MTSIAFALMFCLVLYPASLYGRNGISRACTGFELEEGEIMQGDDGDNEGVSGISTSPTSGHSESLSSISF